MSNIALEVYEAQNDIISLQSEIIKNLISALLQHISAEEMDKMPFVDLINEVATIRAEHNL